MDIEVAICDLTPDDGAWAFAKAIRAKKEITGADCGMLKLSIWTDEESLDRQVFLMVKHGDNLVASAHVDVDMLLYAAKALKAFKDTQSPATE